MAAMATAALSAGENDFSYLHFTTEIPSNIPVQIFQTIIK